MTLAQRITAILAATGYRPYSEAPPEATHHSGPFFLVSEDDGATVRVAWADATEGECRLMLHRYGIRLNETGLKVEHRGDCLHVSETPAPDGDGPLCSGCGDQEDGGLGD